MSSSESFALKENCGRQVFFEIGEVQEGSETFRWGLDGLEGNFLLTITFRLPVLSFAIIRAHLRGKIEWNFRIYLTRNRHFKVLEGV